MEEERALVCDDCMKEFGLAGFPPDLGYDEQLHFAREEGWKIGSMFNFCPDCQGEENDE